MESLSYNLEILCSTLSVDSLFLLQTAYLNRHNGMAFAIHVALTLGTIHVTTPNQFTSIYIIEFSVPFDPEEAWQICGHRF